MSAKSKVRVSTSIVNATLSVNEKILKECHELYSEEEFGNTDQFKYFALQFF